MVVVDISDAVLLHTVVGQVGHLYGFALHLDGHLLARRWSLNLQHHRCARLATQVVADVCSGLSNHRFAVYTQYHVSLLQSGFSSRHSLVRLVDDDVLACEAVAYYRADARIFARHHLLVFSRLVLGEVVGVWVERVHHRAYCRSDGFVGIERVDVHQVEIAVDGIENVKVLCHAEVVVAGVLCHDRHSDSQECHQHQAAHCFCVFA